MCQVKHRSRFFQKSRAGGRDARLGAWAAIEQPHSEFALKLVDLDAQWRLGDVEALGGPPEAELFGDRNEVAQVVQFH